MTTRHHTGFAGSSLEANYDAALLSRLGNALAHAYDDTITSSLPPALQSLVEQLERVSSGKRAAVPADERGPR